MEKSLEAKSSSLESEILSWRTYLQPQKGLVFIGSSALFFFGGGGDLQK